MAARAYTDIDDLSPINWRVWVAALLFALLLHFLVFVLKPDLLMPARYHPRMEVQQIDPSKLEAIRKQWDKIQNNENKQLLLNKDKSLPKDETAPPDARYMSDRNIRVKKEQRARDTDVIPRPGGPVVGSPKSDTAPMKRQKSDSRPLPRLGSLGVPLRLNGKPKPKDENDNGDSDRASDSRSQQPRGHTQQGGDQAILDRNLPLGSENLLNAQESVYYSFYARLYEAIGPLWKSKIQEVPYRRRLHMGDYSTVVDVVLDRNGNLVAINQLQSSGVPELDEAVRQSWHKISRFPNPPSGLLNDKGEVHTGWTFTVQVNDSVGVQFLPPERNY